MNNLLLRIPQRYWAYLALLFWGIACFMLMNKSPYGIDEGAAQALLLTWSVVDNVVSSIVTLGLPDFRAIFLVPAGFLWTGNVMAAKITTLIVMAVVAWALNSWRRRNGGAEGALVATGLLLISPLIFNQLDSISVAPYLLFTFVLGAWADLRYRESPQAFGGVYFAQIILCLVSVTLHPAGLAYPIALLWTWYKNPLNKKQQSYFFVGVAFVVTMALVLTKGWSHVVWFSNPVKGFSSMLLGPSGGAKDFGSENWMSGIGMVFVLLVVLWKQASNLWHDFLGRVLLIALAISLLTGDQTLGVITLTVCLYWGLPLLMENDLELGGGFWQQRGVVLVLIVVISTTYMMIDKTRYLSMLAGQLAPSDSLIKAFVENIEDLSKGGNKQITPADKPLRIASQWPARTMLACRCDTLPLPPDAKNEQSLFEMLQGLKYLIFDPRDPVNHSLSRNLSVMSSVQVETVALQLGGVIVEIKTPPISKTSE